jgi:hypothetical protein
MKLTRLILVILAVVVLAGRSHSQVNTSDSTIIAFSFSDRDSIVSYQQFAAGTKTILKSNNAIKVDHLSVLGATSDGKSLLIGGKLNFIAPEDGTKDSIYGFFRIDLPFTLGTIVSLDRKNIGNIKILRHCWVPGIKPLPLGALSSNGSDWYGIFHKTGGSKLVYYHGKFDGSGTTDSLAVEAAGGLGEYATSGGYHMTNLSLAANGMLVCGIMDKLNTGDDRQQRLQIHRWRPTAPTGETQFQSSQINSLKGQMGNHNVDSAFACLLRVIPGQNPPKAEIALWISKTDPVNYEMYNFPYETGVSLSKDASRNIPGSALPDTLHYFQGWYGNVQNEFDDKETTTEMQRYNNGGDMMYDPTGDNVVFVAHDSGPEGTVSGAKTGIWWYSIKDGGASTFLYNNPSKKERSPIYLGTKAYVEPPPPPSGTIVITPTELNFDTTEVGTSKLLQVTVSNPSDYSVYIKSIEPSGSDDYSIVGAVPIFIVPDSLKGKSSVVLTIKFSPTTVGHLTAAVKVNYKDSSKVTIFHGEGYKKTSGGVVDNPTKFSVTISPNPFRTSAHVSISSPEEIGYTVKLNDALGRNIAIDPLPYSYFRAGAADYEINAEALGLSAGTYYLTISGGGETVTRQLILTK